MIVDNWQSAAGERRRSQRSGRQKIRVATDHQISAASRDAGPPQRPHRFHAGRVPAGKKLCHARKKGWKTCEQAVQKPFPVRWDREPHGIADLELSCEQLRSGPRPDCCLSWQPDPRPVTAYFAEIEGPAIFSRLLMPRRII